MHSRGRSIPLSLQHANLLRVFLFAFIALLAAAPLVYAEASIHPKVLVIATYETGHDTGDTPGELQYWVEREHLDQSIAVSGIDHPILTNGKGLYAMISGTTSRCAVQMMALAMDPRFDLTHTYFLLSGIAGADPERITVGSAVWIRQVVDGDPLFELDRNDAPADWPYGLVALGATKPNAVPANVDSAPAAGVSDNGSGGVGRIAYHLNRTLADWAFQLSKDVALPDTEALATQRALYKSFPNTQHKPAVLEGESLGTDHFWTGPIMTQWARDWVRLYTRDTGALFIADCEDQGMVLALAELNRLGRADFNRLLILRTASNYTLPPPGESAAKILFEDLSTAPGYIPALEANYRTGSVVADALIDHWDKYETQIP